MEKRQTRNGGRPMNKVKNIAKEGICDFDCWYCKLQNDCMKYNHKDKEPAMDQKEVRKRFAKECIMRVVR